jgi:hypothetical protein
MPNGTRAILLALFFVLGMGFMAAMFMLANPQWSEPERVREMPRQEKTKLIFVEEIAPSAEPPVEEKIEGKPAVAGEKVQPVAERSFTATARSEPEIVQTPVAEVAIQIEPKTVLAPIQSAEVIRPLLVANLGGPGTLRGRVTLVGTPPAEKDIPLDAKCAPEVEGLKMKTQFFVVGPENGLANVVVKVVSPVPKGHWIASKEPLVVAAFRCRFDPYVSAVQSGRRLVIENRDPTLHTAHVITSLGDERNYSLLPKGKPVELRLEHAREVKIRCNLHPWEWAFVTVVEHPFFAVTDAEGKFEIKGLPAGKYVVEAAHRKAGTNTISNVEVGKEGGFVEFRLQVPKS